MSVRNWDVAWALVDSGVGRLSPAIGTLGDGAVRDQVVRALRLWLDLTGD